MARQTGDGVDVCHYFLNGAIVEATRDWVPCWLGNATNPYVPCCQVGSYCMNDNICMTGNGDNQTYWDADPTSSQYYVSGCTDPTYEDPNACTSNCEQDAYAQITYVSDIAQWQCCANETSNSLNCSAPPTEEHFRADAPTDLSSITSLGANYAAYVTGYVEGASVSLLSVWETNAAEYTSEYKSLYPTAAASWYGGLPSIIRSDIQYGTALPGALAYTGPGPLSGTGTAASTAKPQTTAAPTTSSTSPTHTGGGGGGSSSNADVIGPAVGVPLGVLLIAAIVFGIWFMRRKKRRARQATAAINNPAPNVAQHGTPGYYDQASPPPQQSYNAWPQGGHGGYYTPVPQQDKGPTDMQQAYQGAGYSQAGSPPQEAHRESYLGAPVQSGPYDRSSVVSGPTQTSESVGLSPNFAHTSPILHEMDAGGGASHEVP